MVSPPSPLIVSSSVPRVRAPHKMYLLWRLFARYLFVLPALLFLSIFLLYPMLSTAVFSFEQVNIGSLLTHYTPWIGWQNYHTVLADPGFWDAARTSLFFTLGSLLFQFSLGFLLALLFNKPFPLARLLRALLMIAWMLPIVVSGTIFKWMFQQDTGIINYLLISLKLVQKPVPWLLDPKIALIAPVIANIWIGIPFNLTLLLSGLQSIPTTIYEAARIDGANGWQRFWSITLPLMRSSSLIVLTLGTIYTMNVFDLLYVMTGGGPVNATKTIPLYAYEQSFSFLNLGNGSAVTMLLLLFLLIIAGLYLLLTQREEVEA